MASTPPTDSPYSKAPIRYTDTTSAYDLWASIYDTDGNFLQAMDTIEMKTLFPRMLSEINSSRPWRIVDLGCGTGRNTTALLTLPDTEVVAIDASPKMLDVAKSRLKHSKRLLEDDRKLHFEVFDLIKFSELPASARDADAVVSTLVIEHIPADTFFSHVSKMLKPGGVLLITNMHSHMGGISQAGFVDPKTGDKIRPKSYAHTVDEVKTAAAAAACGLEPIGEIEERAVDENMVEQLGVRSQKWVGITCWFGGLFRKTL